MNIKLRLSFQFMFIEAGILLFFALLVYYFTYSTQREKFRNNLLNRAKNTAILLIDVKEIDSTLLKKIHQSTFYWQDEEIVVTDTSLNIIYNNQTKVLSREVINSNVSSGSESFFSNSGKDGVFYKHRMDNKINYVFVMAYDKTRSVYLHELIQILFWSVLFSLWLSVLLSYLFSKKAIKPISAIVDSVKAIDSSSLNRRLESGDGKDEIEKLAMTFNEMLEKLESSFKNQRDFISNASHELKTPVSVIIAESEYFLNSDHSILEHNEFLSTLINDLRKLNSQLNSLLDLAQSNSNNSINFSNARIDEILYDAIHEVKVRYKKRRIVTKIQFPENPEDLIFLCNYNMLQIAMKNLIDNACKFSSEDVSVELSAFDQYIKLIISDKGIGIPASEVNDIYKPFSRASNATYKSGFGIGLSLVTKILQIHNVQMEVFSQENIGTRVELVFHKTSVDAMNN